jgi:hypothetical protein
MMPSFVFEAMPFSLIVDYRLVPSFVSGNPGADHPPDKRVGLNAESIREPSVEGFHLT